MSLAYSFDYPEMVAVYQEASADGYADDLGRALNKWAEEVWNYRCDNVETISYLGLLDEAFKLLKSSEDIKPSIHAKLVYAIERQANVKEEKK